MTRKKFLGNVESITDKRTPRDLTFYDEPNLLKYVGTLFGVIIIIKKITVIIVSIYNDTVLKFLFLKSLEFERYIMSFYAVPFRRSCPKRSSK